MSHEKNLKPSHDLKLMEVLSTWLRVVNADFCFFLASSILLAIILNWRIRKDSSQVDHDGDRSWIVLRISIALLLTSVSASSCMITHERQYQYINISVSIQHYDMPCPSTLNPLENE